MTASATAYGCVILPADMPCVSPETVKRVAHTIRHQGGIAAPSVEGRRGHPVGFGAEFLAELSALDEEHGARHLLERHRDRLTLIACTDAGTLLDIDTPQDLAALGGDGV